jgi:hypothetical protein
MPGPPSNSIQCPSHVMPWEFFITPETAPCEVTGNEVSVSPAAGPCALGEPGQEAGRRREVTAVGVLHHGASRELRQPHFLEMHFPHFQEMRFPYLLETQFSYLVAGGALTNIRRAIPNVRNGGRVMKCRASQADQHHEQNPGRAPYAGIHSLRSSPARGSPQGSIPCGRSAWATGATPRRRRSAGRP